MECYRALSLVVLTLLQLCRAEIKDVQPQWYSANVINDGFQPKSISELFASDAPFSTANPIIVSSLDGNDDIRMLSSLSTPTTRFTESSTPFPPSSQSTYLSSSQSPVTQFSSTQTPLQQFMTSMTDSVEVQPIEPRRKTTTESQRSVTIKQDLYASTQTLPSNPLYTRDFQIQQDQTASTQTLPQNPPMVKLTTFSQPMETTPQDLRVESVPQVQTSFGPDAGLPQNIQPLPNYFVIYQPPPGPSFPYPSSSPIPTLAEQTFTTAAPISSTFPATFSSSPTFSTLSSSSITTSPIISTTTLPPVTQSLKTSTIPRVTVTSSSSIGVTRNVGSSSTGNRVLNCSIISTTPLPRSQNFGPIPVNQMFPLKISVRGPSGSITNVNFNPVVKAAPTPRPKTTKGTRKPTTKRTPKPKKNTYERCLQGCRKNGQNLCAAPLSQAPVDPKTLKGFPSVCHMACHNSYRKDPYEKITDGSCSRLRTRIRPVDSNSKLKKDELHKVQYFLDNGGPQAVVEVSGTYS